MNKKYYIYILIIGLLSILSILYIKYFSINTIESNSIKEKDEKKYFLDIKPKIINNTNITKSNKF